MLIDCDTCAARNIHCSDCVVAVLLGPRNGSVELDSAEQDALGAFATGGLLPPLRLVPTMPPELLHRDNRHKDHLRADQLRDATGTDSPHTGSGTSAIA